ncbi:hypothetical protein [Halorientalis pallida]|uniref:hypothetical protein n=1 Tax=Halorientalis pallida TaxID=2479928 RepID=UPI00100AF3BB|nr:hypothetical protein [Halorientalis pallida]
MTRIERKLVSVLALQIRLANSVLSCFGVVVCALQIRADIADGVEGGIEAFPRAAAAEDTESRRQIVARVITQRSV